jgi:cbb3-type cytochrome oxidase subunit 3
MYPPKSFIIFINSIRKVLEFRNNIRLSSWLALFLVLFLISISLFNTIGNSRFDQNRLLSLNQDQKDKDSHIPLIDISTRAAPAVNDREVIGFYIYNLMRPPQMV